MSATNSIDLLRELCEAISESGARIKSLAERIGTVREQALDQLEVTPYALQIQSATIMPLPDSQEPNFVRLTLEKGVPLEALQQAFGTYRKTPPMPGKPASAWFRVETQSSTHNAVILVPLDTATPKSVTIRRDMRL